VRALSRPVPLTALVLAGALAAWIITVQRMRGMDAGPGTDLGGLGWYVGIWVTMTAAMMLPSAAPVVLLFSRAWSERTQGAALVPAAIFVSGYLVVWTP
jgi:predicted metal-binding membrane protein